MTPDDFFEEGPSKSSLVKIRIVVKYFRAWATIMVPKTRGLLCYADLYAGEGAYAGGTPSVPLEIVEAASKDADLSQRLVTIFNDRDEDTVALLRQAIDSCAGVDKLTHRPKVLKYEVGRDDRKILSELPARAPRVTFLDPFGYKGLSMDLVKALTTPPKSECIMLFNTNRIVAAVSNKRVQETMSCLFGPAAFARMRKHIDALSGLPREKAILEEVKHAFREQNLQFVLAFRFPKEHLTRTSHHLIHGCKHRRGYDIMKDVMQREASRVGAGAVLFEYDPKNELQPRLLEHESHLGDLRRELAGTFAGRTLAMVEVYEQHHVDRPWVKRDYKQALSRMEEEGHLRAKPPRGQRRLRNGEPTFADDVVVTFPPRKEK